MGFPDPTNLEALLCFVLAVPCWLHFPPTADVWDSGWITTGSDSWTAPDKPGEFDNIYIYMCIRTFINQPLNIYIYLAGTHHPIAFPTCFTLFEPCTELILHNTKSMTTQLILRNTKNTRKHKKTMENHQNIMVLFTCYVFLEFCDLWFFFGVPDQVNTTQSNFTDCCNPSESFNSIQCLVDSISSLFVFEGGWHVRSPENDFHREAPARLLHENNWTYIIYIVKSICSWCTAWQ